MKKSDFNGVLFSLFFLTKNNTIIAGLSYALTISLANSLGPEQFGIYSEALLIASILSIVVNFGTDQTAVVFYSNIKNEKVVFNDIFTTRILMALICLALLSLSPKIDHLLFYFVACLSLSTVNLAFLYEIRRKNERYSYIFLVERTTYVGLAFLLIYANYLKLYHLFSILAFVTGASIIYQYIDNRNFLHIDGVRLLRVVRQTFVENLPLVIVALSNFAYGGFSRLILETKLGSGPLGVYSAGWQLIAIGTVYQAQVSRIWRIGITEAIYAQDVNRLMKKIYIYILLGTLPMIAVCLSFIFGAKLIVNLFFSSAYSGLTEVLPILGIYLVVINVAGLVDMLWIALRKNRIYMLVNLISGFSLLLVLVEFSDGIGMIGFAAISVLFHLITTVVLASIWLLHFKQRVSSPA